MVAGVRNVPENLMVEEIARYAGFSARQLQRQFQRVLGQSIRQYLIRTLVHAATRELLHSEHSLGEIALGFGFNDQSAFSNAFRSIIGMCRGNTG
jgi:transcriptional regulator GlxA family with amidase domain